MTTISQITPIPISDLPDATTITGNEATAIVQDGQTVQTPINQFPQGMTAGVVTYGVTGGSPFPNYRTLKAGSGIDITDAGAQSDLTISLSTSGTAAPKTASYVVMGLDSGLSNERVLAVGGALTLTDGGANSNVTIGTSALSGAVTSSANSFVTTLASGIDAVKIGGGTVSNTEFGYLDGVTSAIQTQLNAKGSGTVTSVSVTTANGISGSVATATTTPAITLSLGDIVPTSVNSIVLSGSSTPTLAVTGTTTVSGTNTGDQTSVSGNAGTATALQNARTIGGVSFNGTANITVASATGGFTVSGGNLTVGANDITCTGSLGSTGSRLTKGWFTDLQSTNAIAADITGNSATVTTINGKIAQGTNITISGSGTSGSPYTISASGGGVSSLNSLTGALSLTSPNSTITVGTSGSNVTADFNGTVTGNVTINQDSTPTQRIIKIQDQATSNTAGNSLLVAAGLGNGSGAGGTAVINSGRGGAIGNGGTLTIQGGAGGSTSGNGGDVNITGGTKTSGTNGGVFLKGNSVGIIDYTSGFKALFDVSNLIANKSYEAPNTNGVILISTTGAAGAPFVGNTSTTTIKTYTPPFAINYEIGGVIDVTGYSAGSVAIQVVFNDSNGNPVTQKLMFNNGTTIANICGANGTFCGLTQTISADDTANIVISQVNTGFTGTSQIQVTIKQV